MTFSLNAAGAGRVCTLTLLLGLAGAPWAATPVAQRAATTTDDAMARVIVSFKPAASGRVQTRSANPVDATDRMAALGTRSGLALRSGFSIGPRSQVVMASGMTSAELAARLAAMPDVEYAVVDRRRRAYAVPNDPLYSVGGSRGPVAGQWYLRAPNTSTPAAINAESAWDTSTGSNSVVVAVLDTGVRYDHADLLPVAQGGNLLPGYDFVSDSATANDGDGRDSDASDPGDWVSAAENAASGAFPACGVSNSSWHGTEVAALIAATPTTASAWPASVATCTCCRCVCSANVAASTRTSLQACAGPRVWRCRACRPTRRQPR